MSTTETPSPADRGSGSNDLLGGWQPIETAPKEPRYEDGQNRYGRHILIWANGYDEPMRARWWYRTDSDAKNFIVDGGWAAFPSHWMPLPPPPVSA